MHSLATVTPRNETVYLASLKKENISQCALVIMKLLLYQSEDRFFSYTEYENEISLIVDETIFLFFPPEMFICKEPWNVLQVDMGSCGIPSEAGIVSLVGSLLAQKSINVYYVSTFHHDYVLVPKKHFVTALDWLKQNLESRSDIPSLLQLQPPAPSSPTANQLIKLKSSMYFASCGPEKIGKALQHLLKIIFFETNSRFFSFTSVDDELSLLLDKEHLDLFPAGCLVVTEEWQPIKRDKKDDLFETGVVGYISSPLAKEHISVLYLSTYHTSFILVRSPFPFKLFDCRNQGKFGDIFVFVLKVPKTKFGNAVAALEVRNFNVMDRKPQVPATKDNNNRSKRDTSASPLASSSSMIQRQLSHKLSAAQQLLLIPPATATTKKTKTTTTTPTTMTRRRKPRMTIPTKAASISELESAAARLSVLPGSSSTVMMDSIDNMNMNNLDLNLDLDLNSLDMNMDMLVHQPQRVAPATLFDSFDRVDIASCL